MLAVEGLVKRYGSVVAASGISLKVDAGETVGLLGPNGAGKTTTVSIIAGLIRADAGRVLIEGAPLSGDADEKKRAIGLVPQDLALYEELSAAENLRVFGALYGLDGEALEKAAADALTLVSLADRRKDLVKTFSGGMKRRLNLAASILHDPRLLILDEPTVGVDAQSRNAIFDNLEALKKRGKSILYTTHYMEEAERLCERIVIVDHGKVVADDTLAGLRKKVQAEDQLVVELVPPHEGDLEPLRALPEVIAASLDHDRLVVGLRELGPGVRAVLAWLAETGWTYQHLSTVRADLETIFLALTGRTLRDA